MQNSLPLSTDSSAQRLIAGVKRLKMDTEAVDKSFKSIDFELGRISAKLGSWHFLLRPKIQQFEEAWRTHHNVYRDLLWQSRENAGAAQAMLENFITTCLPQLLKSEVSFQQKKDLIELEINAVTTHQKRAQETSARFKTLIDGVENTIKTWSVLVENEKDKLRHSERLKDMLEKLLANLGSMPHPTYSITHVVSLLTDASVSIGSMAHRNKCSKDSDSGHLRSHCSAGVLLMKLGTICNIWAGIRAELQQIAGHLEIQKQVRGSEAFQSRTENNHRRFVDLIEALGEYQSVVADSDRVV